MMSYGAKHFSLHKNFYWIQTFSRPNFFGQKFFSDQKNLGNKIFQTQHFFRPNVKYDALRMEFDFGVGPTCSYFGWCLRAVFDSDIFWKFLVPLPPTGFQTFKLKLGHFWERKSRKLFGRTVWQNSWFSQTISHIDEKVLLPSSVSVGKFGWSSKVGKGK